MELCTLLQIVKARGNVEDWLCKLDEAISSSLRKIMKSALADYFSNTMERWILSYPSQVDLWLLFVF